MENKFTFCDYINNANFMKLSDEGSYFEITMKAIIDQKTNSFYDLDGNKIDKYKYRILFLKSAL